MSEATAQGRHRLTARLVIMGPQGSGKGTQAARLAEYYEIPAISTGDIFRANIAGKTELGQLAQQYTSAGNLVPDEVTNGMVRSRLAEADAADGFILDGYPRNAAQAEAFDAILADLGWSLGAVVELTAEREELLERLRRRAEIEGREDDTAEAIARRLDIYTEQTAPLTARYQEQGLLLQVDGTGEIADITKKIIAQLAERLG